MNTIKYFFLFLSVALFSVNAQTKWTVDKAHSRIGFSATHMVISTVDGVFHDYTADVTTDGDNFETAKINVTIDVNSIDTQNEQRNNHLKSNDFFNAEKYPEIKFVSKSFKKVDGKNWKLVGDFTIRDVTKEITLDVKFNGMITDPWGNTRAGFKLTGEVNRFDYKLEWNKLIETGGLVVGKEIELNIDLELIKAK